MFQPVNEQTPKTSKANLPGHDDSGYDGLGSASKDQQEVTKTSELYDAQCCCDPSLGLHKLYRGYYTLNFHQILKIFWVIVNYVYEI